MISALHLFWICPLCATIGLSVMAVCAADRTDDWYEGSNRRK